jgi:hypothetical protein
MNCNCPRCGRGTTIDDDLGDFPVRCLRCGSLLRRRRRHRKSRSDDSHLALDSAATTSRMADVIPSAPGLQRGMLARLLIHGPSSQTADVAKNIGVPSRVPSAKSGGFLQRVAIKGRRHALDALTWAGLLTVVLVAALWLWKTRLG